MVSLILSVCFLCVIGKVACEVDVHSSYVSGCCADEEIITDGACYIRDRESEEDGFGRPCLTYHMLWDKADVDKNTWVRSMEFCRDSYLRYGLQGGLFFPWSESAFGTAMSLLRHVPTPSSPFPFYIWMDFASCETSNRTRYYFRSDGTPVADTLTTDVSFWRTMQSHFTAYPTPIETFDFCVAGTEAAGVLVVDPQTYFYQYVDVPMGDLSQLADNGTLTPTSSETILTLCGDVQSDEDAEAELRLDPMTPVMMYVGIASVILFSVGTFLTTVIMPILWGVFGLGHWGDLNNMNFMMCCSTLCTEIWCRGWKVLVFEWCGWVILPCCWPKPDMCCLKDFLEDKEERRKARQARVDVMADFGGQPPPAGGITQVPVPNQEVVGASPSQETAENVQKFCYALCPNTNPEKHEKKRTKKLVVEDTRPEVFLGGLNFVLVVVQLIVVIVHLSADPVRGVEWATARDVLLLVTEGIVAITGSLGGVRVSGWRHGWTRCCGDYETPAEEEKSSAEILADAYNTIEFFATLWGMIVLLLGDATGILPPKMVDAVLIVLFCTEFDNILIDYMTFIVNSIEERKAGEEIIPVRKAGMVCECPKVQKIAVVSLTGILLLCMLIWVILAVVIFSTVDLSLVTNSTLGLLLMTPVFLGVYKMLVFDCCQVSRAISFLPKKYLDESKSNASLCCVGIFSRILELIITVLGGLTVFMIPTANTPLGLSASGDVIFNEIMLSGTGIGVVILGGIWLLLMIVLLIAFGIISIVTVYVDNKGLGMKEIANKMGSGVTMDDMPPMEDRPTAALDFDTGEL